MSQNRRSLRLKDYDYTQPGPYFVTTVTRGRECLFGEVVNGKMDLNGFGQIIEETWLWLGSQYQYVELGKFVVMPNHIHGIVSIGDFPGRDGSRPVPTGGYESTRIKPLGQLIGAFKTVSAKRINLARGTPGTRVWQQDFYERIIRDEKALDLIHRYIAANPVNWQEDDEFPEKR
jgi:REP element-mobilizing transposase RayT